MGDFKHFGAELTPYEKRHWGETPGKLEECKDWVMGDILDVWQNPIVPRVKEHIPKSDPTVTESSAQDNPSIQETEVYSGIGEASPVLATRRLRRPRNKEYSLTSHNCQVKSVSVQGSMTKKGSEGNLESGSPLEETIQESPRLKESFLKLDHKPVASPLAEGENTSINLGAEGKQNITRSLS